MPKQGHQGLTGAKVMTFSEMANQFKTIIWRTTQKDKEEFLKGDEEFLKARQTILCFYQAWAKIFHAMSGTSTDDEIAIGNIDIHTLINTKRILEKHTDYGGH